ncbi:hypothetical protein M569_15111 [Genlisea aurea]|uniref:SOSEKI DIX-like domain-containing protein n=1 Tax=Genlisea aurea TaxID=192259 RepID=S8BZ41_9LAMI|nr:hypothetical protein M569_15111 [Genlisea aurea]
MEGRVKNYRQLSPDRAKVWTEKSPKYYYDHDYGVHQQQKQIRKVPVVYYLCRNRQLEHPHFMEVPLASSGGLYLRDVIERLNVLRGRGMASLYSWSCKRSYKSGFVWHDLCENDLILPVHGSEYVLKGSELFEEHNSAVLIRKIEKGSIRFAVSVVYVKWDFEYLCIRTQMSSPECGRILGSGWACHFSPSETVILQNPKALPEPPSSRSQEESSSSSSLNGRATTKTSNDDELSPPDQRPCSSNVSPEYKNPSWNGSLTLTEYKVYANDGLADASTQTEDNIGARSSCRGVSTEDVAKPIREEPPREYLSSTPPSASPAASSSGRTDTLESLIRADARKLNGVRILEEDEFRIPSSNARLKASSMILQLISCGSISVKDHSFGFVPTYKPRFSSSKFSSPLFSTSVMLGELDRLYDNPRLMGMKLEDKEYFSGSLVETSMNKEGLQTLKRSSSFNADGGVSKIIGSVEEEKDEGGGPTRTKCIPRSIKTKQPKCESGRSPASSSDVARVSSSDRALSCSGNTSRRIGEPPSGRKQLGNNNKSIDEDEENVIKIEES